MPRAARKPRNRYHHGDLKAAALDAAAKDIDAHGHVAFSLERIAKALGVTPAALYRHFENRDELLREVMWRTFLRYVEAVDGAALAPGELDPLVAIGRAFVRFGVANPGWFRVQFSPQGLALSDRQSQSQPEYGEVMAREIKAMFGDDEATRQRWHLTLWAFIHGVTSFAVDHVFPPLQTDEERVALADTQIDTFMSAMRAAAKTTR